MTILKDKKFCTGCSACAAACSFKAIKMVENEEGFLVPLINQSKCVQCGNCEKVCKNASVELANRPLKVFAGINKDNEILMKSSSGGIFGALAEHVLLGGGAVAGCIFTRAAGAHHVLTDERNVILKMQGTKYVQSRVDASVYCKIQEYLKQNRRVLFIGTPCQAAGLQSYLGCDYKQLVTVDLICHGVPSPRLLDKYLDWREDKFKERIESISFRSKARITKGIPYLVSIGLPQKTKYIYAWADPYYASFAKSNNYRESCYSCEFACPKRVGDITMGDYWGVSKYHKDIETGKGVSALMVNTDKGLYVTKYIKDKLMLTPSMLENAVQGQSSLRHPTVRPSSRDTFYQQVSEHGYDKIARDFFKSSDYRKSWILCKTGYLLPVKVRNKIKKLLKNKTSKMKGK